MDGTREITGLTASALWALFSSADMACQDCFTVELSFDPARGPVLLAYSCTVQLVGPCETLGDLRAAVHAALVDDTDGTR